MSLLPAACCLSHCSSSLPVSAHAQATIAGTWFTEDSSSKVTITQSGNAYTGKVTWVKTDRRRGREEQRSVAPHPSHHGHRHPHRLHR